MSIKGTIRNIDSLGRISIPSEFRKSLDINSGDPIELIPDGEQLILRKYDMNITYQEKLAQMIEHMKQSDQDDLTYVIGKLKDASEILEKMERKKRRE